MKIIQICYKRDFHLSLAKYKWEFYETGSEFKNAQVWQKHAKMYEWRHSTHLIRIVWRLAWLLCTLFYGKFYTFGIVGTETSSFSHLHSSCQCIKVNSVLNGCLPRKKQHFEIWFGFLEYKPLSSKVNKCTKKSNFATHKAYSLDSIKNMYCSWSKLAVLAMYCRFRRISIFLIDIRVWLLKEFQGQNLQNSYLWLRLRHSA